MVINLKDKEGNLSGKGFNSSLLELFSRNKANKDVEVFKRIAESMTGSANAGKVLAKEYLNLTSSGQKFARELVHAKKPIAETKQGFLDAAQSAEKLTFASKAASVGMKALAMVGNMAIMAGVSFVLSLPSRIAQAQENARQTTIDSTQKFQEDLQSLDEYKVKIEELKNALDSGNLSQAESYDARAQLMQIQNKLIEKYGEEAGAIDLVNGSLQTQIKKLDEIAVREASKNLAANKSINEKSVREMETSRSYLIGLEVPDSAKHALDSLIKEFKYRGISIDNNGVGSGTFNIRLSANAEDAEKTLSDFSSKLRALDIDNYVKDSISNYIEDSIQNAQETLDKWSEIYAGYNFERIITDNDYSKVYQEAENALQHYIEVAKQGDQEQISSALDTVAAIKEKALNTENIGFQDFFEDFFANIDTELDKRQFKIDIEVNTDGIKQALNDLDGLDDLGILNIGQIEGTDSQEAAFDLLSQKAEEYGTSIEGLIDWLVEFGIVQSRVADNVNQKPISMALSTEDANKQIDSLQAAYDTLTATIKEYNENNYITFDSMQSLLALGNEYLQYLTIENGQIKLNQEGLIALAYTRIDDAEAAYLQKSTELMQTFLDQKKAADWLAESIGALSEKRLDDARAAYEEAYASALAAGADSAKAAEQLNNTVRNVRSVFDQVRSSLGSYSSAVISAGHATKNAINEMKQAMQSAQSAINSLLTMTMNMIKQGYEAQKKKLQKDLDKLKDDYDAQKDRIDDLYDSKKDALDAEKKGLEEIYKQKQKQYNKDKQAIEDQIAAQERIRDIKLEALQAEKDAYYWEKELAEFNKSIAELESDIAIASKDDSQEGIARRKELEEQLAQKKEELADKQFDRSIEQQEDAINKEFDRFKELKDNELDILDRNFEREKEQHDQKMQQLDDEAEKLQKQHQTALDNIESRYEANRASLEKQLNDLNEYTSIEGNIRKEAFELINQMSEELYQKLIEWNRLYGTGVDADVTVAWENAYAALEKFNQYGKIDVLSTLNYLVTAINEFKTATDSAATSAANLASNMRDINSLKSQDLGKYPAQYYYDMKNGKKPDNRVKFQKFADGGVDTTGGLKMMHGTSKSPEVVFNAFDAKKLYDFIHRTPDLAGSIMRQMDNRFNKIRTSSNISSFSSQTGDISIKQGDVIVQGGMDKSTLQNVKQIFSDNAKLLKDLVCDEIMKQQHRRGHGNLAY